MSDATKRTCGCDWSLWETCDECNPDDEAAEIRRLRTRLAESEAEVGRLTNKLNTDSQTLEIECLKAEVGRLTRSCDGWQGDARLYARNAADWEAKARTAEAERDDLLARIHRDGGHYVLEHGVKKACADADLIVANLYAERDGLLGALREIARVDTSVGEGGNWQRGYCERGDRARAAIAKVGGK